MEVDMTVQDTVTTTIRAPLEAVWPWVADITRHAEWSPKPYRVDLVSGDLNAVGSRYRSVGWVPPNESNHANDVEITEVVPMSRFALRATDESGTFASTFDFLPVDGGTQVTFHIEFPAMKGLNAVMVPLLFPIVAKPDFRKRLGLLKRKVETAQ
jgi:uncharacterized protein YndB with AHSA1/START domain